MSGYYEYRNVRSCMKCPSLYASWTRERPSPVSPCTHHSCRVTTERRWVDKPSGLQPEASPSTPPSSGLLTMIEDTFTLIGGMFVLMVVWLVWSDILDRYHEYQRDRKRQLLLEALKKARQKGEALDNDLTFIGELYNVVHWVALWFGIAAALILAWLIWRRVHTGRWRAA